MANRGVEYRCFVGGLAWATNDRNLEAAFSQYSEILDSKIIMDRDTGRSRRFGFVTFATDDAMRNAIHEMNGKDLDGRNINVNKARPRLSGGGRSRYSGQHGGGGGGYRGGGGGGGYGFDRGSGYDQGGGGYVAGGGNNGGQRNGGSKGQWRNLLIE